MIKLIIILILLSIFFSPLFLFIKILKNKKNKQKVSSWEGGLEDKEHLEYEDDDSSYTKDIYTLYFKTTKNEKIKMNVTKKVYDTWKIGEKAQKEDGKMLPEKIS